MALSATPSMVTPSDQRPTMMRRGCRRSCHECRSSLLRKICRRPAPTRRDELALDDVLEPVVASVIATSTADFQTLMQPNSRHWQYSSVCRSIARHRLPPYCYQQRLAHARRSFGYQLLRSDVVPAGAEHQPVVLYQPEAEHKRFPGGRVYVMVVDPHPFGSGSKGAALQQLFQLRNQLPGVVVAQDLPVGGSR